MAVLKYFNKHSLGYCLGVLFYISFHQAKGQGGVAEVAVASTIKYTKVKEHSTDPVKETDYLKHVREFADNLLKHGQDSYGAQSTPMWASVINVKNWTVPLRNVHPTEGVRDHDRALGGSNYYHDVVTLKVFDALSVLTGDDTYRKAASDYTGSFLKRAQNPETGLLGWGEHLYYNFYTDTVTIGENRIYDPRDYFKFPHELLPWTPPWDRLWLADSDKTQKAIEGLQYHYQGPDPKVYLFNRHAAWNKAEYQEEVMPWIKHSVLFSYSFAYLYYQSKDEKWKKWSRDAGMCVWDYVTRKTDFILNDLSPHH